MIQSSILHLAVLQIELTSSTDDDKIAAILCCNLMLVIPVRDHEAVQPMITFS